MYHGILMNPLCICMKIRLNEDNKIIIKTCKYNGQVDTSVYLFFFM